MRDRWLQMVQLCARSDRDPLIRREHARVYITGRAKLLFSTEGAAAETPRGLDCQLLQVSPDGLMVRSHAEMRARTPVCVEFCVDTVDEVFALCGEVVHSTQTVGGFKLGIQLKFD